MQEKEESLQLFVNSSRSFQLQGQGRRTKQQPVSRSDKLPFTNIPAKYMDKVLEFVTTSEEEYQGTPGRNEEGTLVRSRDGYLDGC
jgi:hypothetical protein